MRRKQSRSMEVRQYSRYRVEDVTRQQQAVFFFFAVLGYTVPVSGCSFSVDSIVQKFAVRGVFLFRRSCALDGQYDSSMDTKKLKSFRGWFVWPCRNLPFTVRLLLVHDNPKLQVQSPRVGEKSKCHAGLFHGSRRLGTTLTLRQDSRLAASSHGAPKFSFRELLIFTCRSSKANVSWKCRLPIGNSDPESFLCKT